MLFSWQRCGCVSGGTPGVPNFKFDLEYDGSDFEGWQVQAAGRRTVQGVLETAIARVTGQSVRVNGSGRTDAGVHAEGQAASVKIDTELAPEALARALNGTLPPDAAVVAAQIVPDDFHARFSARGKLYRYRIWNGPARSPLRARWALPVSRQLDVSAMSKAAEAFVGRHDFAALQGAGSEVESTVRTIHRLEIQHQPLGEILFWVEGDGFLRHMVRNLVGTLLEVGTGRRSAESMMGLLAAGDRRRAGPNVPAQGLTLVRVYY
jgi:tRNA pseudouridine38-40 synthase